MASDCPELRRLPEGLFRKALAVLVSLGALLIVGIAR
jgi:hypothetical protein